MADLLALYYLDALDRRSGEQVGHHLQSCQLCRTAATEVCETLAALALLSDDGDDLLNHYGALGTAVPPAFPARFAPQELAGPAGEETQETDKRRFRHRRGRTGVETAARKAPAAAGPDLGQGKASQQRVAPPPVAPVQKPSQQRIAPPPVAPIQEPPQQRAAPRPVAPVHKPPPIEQRAALPAVPTQQPAARRPLAHPTRPGFDRPPDIPHAGDGQRARSTRKRLFSRRSATLASLSALLLLTLTVAGIAARALLDPPALEGQPVTVPTAVASATDPDSGANMSVLLTEGRDRVTVRATLSGLDEGTGYRLYGYTFDGRRWPLVNWTGRTGVHEVAGELPVGIADLSHIAVTHGARVVVTVFLPRSAGTPATPGR
ncbi:hypothetical protein MRQ36_01810 [Micromonospora sp. R77]|uniref:hypothetical protein n=1 Tax=Micromonospora sp. R77 TaxID=2925836 RepID=UPI001F61284E|nr:hypothetical protein [Micromonospora sp. R77]MCI4061376.1 hypothetical protein [Micromonospora sp. R77]